MAKRKAADDTAGSTFADLYDIQQEMGRQQGKPLGRPPNKVKRNPTTVHLTKEEKTALNKLHLVMGEYLSLNKSMIVGIALETLTEVLELYDEDELLSNARSADDIKQRVQDLLRSG